MSPARKPAEVLAEARRRDSREKRAKVLAAVDQLAASGEAVTFAAVARSAEVSNWLVYAPGIREHIEAAKVRQVERGRRQKASAAAAGAASFKADLEMARQEITALRAERDKLKNALRRQIGHHLDLAATTDLVARVQELGAQNQELRTANESLVHENAALTARTADAEEDLAAARASLRKMIRTGN